MQKRIKGVRFSWNLRFWFYTIFGILFLSGAIWMGIYYYEQLNDSNIETFAWIKLWLLRIHGAAAMASLVLLGFLIPRHMQRGWAQDRNRVTAIILILWCSVLVLSGYGLYYCGDEVLRFYLRNIHGIAGILIVPALIWHILSGKRK